MKTLSITLALALLLGVAPRAGASPFGPGEQSILKVSYSGFRAGTATITVGTPTKQGLNTVWPIVTLADTESLFALYPLHDKFVSWWDAAQNRSLGWDFVANENRKNRRERVKLNSPNVGKALIQRVSDEGSQASDTADMDPTAQDIAAAFFTLRRQELRPGGEVRIPVFTGKNAWDLVARVGQPEQLKVEAGQFQALPLEVEVHFSGKLESKRNLHVWLSNDAHHALLKLQAELALGSINAELVEYHAGNDVPEAPVVAQ